MSLSQALNQFAQNLGRYLGETPSDRVSISACTSPLACWSTGCFSTLEFTAIYVYLAFVVRRHTCLHNASSHAATPMLGRYCIVSAPYDNDMAPDITPQYLIFANRNHASADDISHTYVHKGEPYPNYSLR